MTQTQYRGDDIDIHGTAIDVDGNPVPLLGSILYCSAKSGANTQASDSFAVEDASSGAYRVRFASATTAAMPVGQWSFDVRAKLPGGEVVTIGTGSFPLADAKTPTPT